MEDKSLHNSQQSQAISESLQSFIDSMVEEIVLEGKPFDSQKKYLKKFSENEGVDYDKLEADITTFIEILDSFKTAFSKLQVKLAEEKGSECYISKEMQDKLIKHSSPVKEIGNVGVDSQPKLNKEERKSYSTETWIWGISAVFMVFGYSKIVAFAAEFFDKYFPFFEIERSIITTILFAGLAFLCWAFRKKGKTLLIMWGVAAIWLFVYCLLNMYLLIDDSSIYLKCNAILNLLAITVIAILARSYFRKKKSSEHVALVTATISSIMILNPIGGLSFTLNIMSLVSVFFIVSIIIMVLKLWKRTSTIRILYSISTVLACYYIIGFLFHFYWGTYSSTYALVIEGVLCSVTAIASIMTWTMHGIKDEIRALLFFIISLLSLSNLIVGFCGTLYDLQEWVSSPLPLYISLCYYTPIFFFWTALICSYLIHPLLHHKTQ